MAAPQRKPERDEDDADVHDGDQEDDEGPPLHPLVLLLGALLLPASKVDCERDWRVSVLLLDRDRDVCDIFDDHGDVCDGDVGIILFMSSRGPREYDQC